MAPNVVRTLRDYLTARDLDSEVAGGLAVDHLSHKPLPLERLPDPLPSRVRSVATTALVVFGVLCGFGALYVLGGALAVVIMPIAMGRQGVGAAMITLFSVCVTFVVSGILLLAARSAARVIRREQRGVTALYAFSVATIVLLVIATAITQWLSVAFLGLSTNEVDQPRFDWSMVVRSVEVLFIIIFARVALVMRGYARTVGSSINSP